MKQALRPYLTPVRDAARRVINDALDVYDGVRGARHPLVPPRNRIFIGAGDFLKTGIEFSTYFRDLGRLRPTDRVLDVGCGLGRMAIPLTTYLKLPGRYDGFDIVPAGIEWCQQRITPIHPNFRFVLADVYNAHYHPEGRSKPTEYRFPYPDANFDFVFLTSVFTHMMSAEMEHYIAEISRVMSTGARCLITYFLLNPESRALVAAGKSRFNFVHGSGELRYAVETDPEAAVAFDEAFVRNLFSRYDLEVKDPVRYGSWSGRPNHVSFQDIVVATRV